MKRFSYHTPLLPTLFTLLLLTLPAAIATAQDTQNTQQHSILGDDGVVKDGAKIIVAPQEAPQGSIPSQKIDHWTNSGLKTYLSLSSSGNIYNDLDFRPTAPPTAPFLDILDSDDRTIYASTKMSAGVTYSPVDALQTALSLSYSKDWGAKNTGTGFSVERLFIKWFIAQSSGFTADLTVGRQLLDIGNFNDDDALNQLQPRDFFLNDVIDGVTLNLDFNKGGKIRLVPIDIYGVGGRPTSSTPAVSPPTATSTSMRFDGNYNTLRLGGIYENTNLLKGLAARAFFFYANIGVNGTGSDRSFNGAAGNVSDHDYNWMTGARLNYTAQFGSQFALGVGAEFAHSGGIDRKAIKAGYYDVDNNGNAYGLSLIMAYKNDHFGLSVPLQFFMADGGKYAVSNGLQYSHGFTSFKGQTVGGLLLSKNLGWRPSAYVGDGVTDTPQSKGRNSGSLVLSGGVQTSILNNSLELELMVWHLRDTNTSNFFAANKNDSPAVLNNKISQAASNAAFGWTRADIEAQQRFGKSLATEIDLGVTYRPLDMLSLYATGAVLLPGQYYHTEIDRLVGNFIGSSNPQKGWGATIGITASL